MNCTSSVCGSDQGLIGQFNDVMMEYVVNTLEKLPGKKTVWAVGERIQSRLVDTDMQQGENFILPNSISAITPLVGQILIEIEKQREKGEIEQIYLFHNRPKTGAIYIPEGQRLLPCRWTTSGGAIWLQFAGQVETYQRS